MLNKIMNMLGFVATKLVNTTLQEQEKTIQRMFDLAVTSERQILDLQEEVSYWRQKANAVPAAEKPKRKYTKSGKYSKKKTVTKAAK